MGNILKCLVILCLCCKSLTLSAQSLAKDVLLSDGQCALHYFTTQDTTGWKLANLDGNCVNGFLSGPASTRIVNAFGKTVSVLKGQFNQGYYIERTDIPLSLNTLFSGSEQLVFSFDLPPDSELSLTYVGYLISEQLSDGDFGPFLACAPVRMMAMTPNIELFEDEIFQQALINSAINRAQTICPHATQIYLYGSEQEKPDNQLISFFADIDLETRQIKVKRLPQSSRMRNVWSSPDTALPVPKEIRHEAGTKVVQITPVLDTPDSPQKPSEPAQSTAQITTFPTISKIVPPVDPGLDTLPNLLTAARLLKQPVFGKALIHIASFDDEGIALIDKPVLLKAKGTGLSIGWGIASGDYTYTAGTQETPRGFIQISQFTPTGDRP